MDIREKIMSNKRVFGLGVMLFTTLMLWFGVITEDDKNYIDDIAGTGDVSEEVLVEEVPVEEIAMDDMLVEPSCECTCEEEEEE